MNIVLDMKIPNDWPTLLQVDSHDKFSLERKKLLI